jgi:hypothetical protein
VAEITLAAAAAPKRVKVECGGKTIPSAFSFNDNAVVVTLQHPVSVLAGQKLMVRIG